MHARRLYVTSLIVSALVLSGLGAASVRAATINVACNANALISAINTANGNGQADTLVLSAGCTYTLTTENNDTDGANFLPSVTSAITIDGNGATIEGDGSRFRLFHVAESGDLTLNQVTVRMGWATSRSGSGVYNRGTLRVEDSTFTENGAPVSDCAAIDNRSTGTATLVDSQVIRNRVGNGQDGAGLCNAGTMSLTRTTVDHNRAGGTGGGILNSGTLDVVASTVSDNSVLTWAGGDLYGSCGGIDNSGALTVRDSTISGNSAVDMGGGICNGGTAQVSNSTIAYNYANRGSGIDSSGTLTLTNSLAAHNRSEYEPGGTDCSGNITSQGYNLDSDGSCGLTAVGDQPSTDPLLAPLDDYGGPTETHALRAGSPALDQGSCRATGTVADQRGLSRPFDLTNVADADDGCDVGAFEAQHPMLTVAPSPLVHEQRSGAISVQTLDLGNEGGAPLHYTFRLNWGGLQLFLPLDEAADATTFFDGSGNDLHGTCVGSACPTAGVPGRLGTALSFDGVNDRVEVPLNIEQESEAPAVTMMAWVYPTSTSTRRHMVLSTDQGGYEWSLLREGATWYVYTGEGSRSTGLSVDVNQWQHIAAVFDPQAGSIRFYKNGVLATIPHLEYHWMTSVFAIGNRPGTTNIAFDGRIDEVHVYDRGLSGYEIQSLYGDPGGVPWLSVDPSAGTVDAYGSAPIAVTLDATTLAQGRYQGRITVTSDDLSQPLVTVPVVLRVTAPAPEIAVEPAGLDEELEQETSVTRTLTISNVGTLDLEVELSEVGGPVSWLATDPMTATIPAGGEQQFEVTLDAAGLDLGEYSAQIRIESNDPATPVLDVPVTMTVGQPGPDEFRIYLPLVFQQWSADD